MQKLIVREREREREIFNKFPIKLSNFKSLKFCSRTYITIHKGNYTKRFEIVIKRRI